MPEHLLDRAQVGSIAKHMRCEAMTQPMRRDSRFETTRDDSALENFLDAASRQAPTAQIDYHGTARFPRKRHRAPPRHQGVQRPLSERYQAVLVALARPDHHHSEVRVDIGPIEADQFADPQSRRIEGLENRAVANRGDRLVVLGASDVDTELVTSRPPREV